MQNHKRKSSDKNKESFTNCSEIGCATSLNQSQDAGTTFPKWLKEFSYHRRKLVKDRIALLQTELGKNPTESVRVMSTIQMCCETYYRKMVGTTYIENLQKLPCRTVSCNNQKGCGRKGVFDFIPVRYSLKEYFDGKIPLLEYACQLVEFGEAICFKALPEWILIFTMEFILIALQSDPEKAASLQIEKAFQKKTIDSKLIEKICAYLEENGISLCQTKSSRITLLKSAMEYYRQNFSLRNEQTDLGRMCVQLEQFKDRCSVKSQFKELICKLGESVSEKRLRRYYLFIVEKMEIQSVLKDLKNLHDE